MNVIPCTAPSCVCGERRASVAGRRRACAHGRYDPKGPVEQRDPLDVGRRVHDRGRLLDRHRPVGADRVPDQLVVVGEPVHRAAHAVGDVVGVLAGDGAVGIADLDALVVALVLDRVLRRRALRPAHRHDVERVHAVVAVLARLVGAHGDVAEDPVVRTTPKS